MPSVATVPVQEESATGPPIAAIPHGDDRGGEGPARSRVRLSDLFTVGVSQPPEWGLHDTIGHGGTLSGSTDNPGPSSLSCFSLAAQPMQPARGHVHNGQQILHPRGSSLLTMTVMTPGADAGDAGESFMAGRLRSTRRPKMSPMGAVS